MSENANPKAWMAMAGMASIGMMAYWWGNRVKKDRKAFYDLVRDKGITDPKEVWDLCCDHHKKLKVELSEAQMRIEEGEEIVRVGQGLAEVRKMMKGPELPGSIRTKQMFGMDVPEEEMSEALKVIAKNTVPTEVKSAIIAHWWTELMKLFVPWGLILPEEIDYVKDPCFRLVGPEIREAVLRMEVHKYKEGYESFKRSFEESMEREKKNFKKSLDERDEWRKEKEALLKTCNELRASVRERPDDDDQ